MQRENIEFRLATDEEVNPGHQRNDRKLFPYMYYVVYVAFDGSVNLTVTNYAFHFIFTNHQLKTSEHVYQLMAWLKSYTRSTNLLLQSFQEIEEEVY